LAAGKRQPVVRQGSNAGNGGRPLAFLADCR